MTLKVRRLDGRAVLPTRAYPGDAGFDLYALEERVLAPGERASVGTGIGVEIPDGQAGLVLPRSGLAARHGISVVNGARFASCCSTPTGLRRSRSPSATGSPSSSW
jgi:deoxyuridine 5'-triphosphate nucleotidohydrolase